MRLNSKNKHLFCLLFLLLSAAMYFYLAHGLERENFGMLISVFSILFALYFAFIYWVREKNITILILGAFLIRLLFLFSEPALSDDVWRFIWDGRLWQAGVNPFGQLPSWFINNDINIPGIDENLYNRLNSKDYFTIYPPVHQLIFWLSTWVPVDKMWISVEIIRLSILAADMGIILLLIPLLDHFGLPRQQLSLYAFNPLVIAELSGNLHFEALLLFFLLLSFFLLLKNRLFWSAFFFAMAISTKLWPLMFLPLLIGKLDAGRLVKFYLIVSLIAFISFAMIVDFGLIQNMLNSVDLYFRKFEFNASFFYLARFAGMQTLGYDPVQTIGPAFGLVTLLLILFLAWKQRKKDLLSLPNAILWAFFIYLSLATTVHPWYIIVLVAMSIFTQYLFPLIWSFLVLFSYAAYQDSSYTENLCLVTAEYVILWFFIIWELKFKSIGAQADK